MLVNGFVGYADISSNYPSTSYFPELVIFCGRYCVKADHKIREKLPEISIGYVERLLSIFYTYDVSVPSDITADKRNFFTQVLVKNIEEGLKDIITFAGGANDFASINIDKRDSQIMRILTHFNLVLSDYSKYLSPLYSNCKIVRDDFEFLKLGGQLMNINTLPKYFEEDNFWPSLVLTLSKLYNDGYKTIRAIVPHAAFAPIEISLDYYSSSYIQCGFIAKSKKIAIKYSREFSLNSYVADAIHAYLLHIKNFDNIYRGKSVFQHIFKIGYSYRIFINERSITSYNLRYSRYSLIIDIHNAHYSKSYLYNLFVVLIYNEIDILAVALDKSGQSYKIKKIQIILSYNNAKEYQLFQNDNFHDRLHMKQTIEKIISNSIILIRKIPEPIACIIPKE